mgnify:CR=1 FL=1
MLTILTSGCTFSDLTVEISGLPCEVIFMASNKITCDFRRNQPSYQINFGDFLTGWEPNVIKIPAGSLVDWKWDLFEMTNEELSKIRVQQTMSKNRVEFNQIGFRSEINTYSQNYKMAYPSVSLKIQKIENFLKISKLKK